MADIIITKTQAVTAKYLQVNAGVRYWEDGVVNGIDDTDDNPSMPCRNDEGDWAPLIDIDEGRIIDWPAGTTASVHYKVCDDGRYSLLDHDKAEIVTLDGYVPSIMCPSDNGYGDYIIMEIDGEGLISNWRLDLDEFERAMEGAA